MTTVLVHIPEMFDIHEILQLESYVINILKLDGQDVHIPPNHYYLEPVGRYLWETKQTDKLALYLLPVIDRILRVNTRYLNGMSYEDAFQSLTLYLIQQMSKYDPSKGTLFTFSSMHTNFHIKTLTTQHYKRKGECLSLTGLNVSHHSNGREVLMEFLSFLDEVKRRRTISPTYRLIYTALSEEITTSQNLRSLTSNPTYTISQRTGLKKDDPTIPEALQELKDEYGVFQFQNKTWVYPTDQEDEQI